MQPTPSAGACSRISTSRISPSCISLSCIEALGAVVLGILASHWPTNAHGQTLSSPAAEHTGLDFFRPPPNMFQLQYEYRTAPGSTRDVTTDTLNFRYDHAFYLSPTWSVVTRA